MNELPEDYDLAADLKVQLVALRAEWIAAKAVAEEAWVTAATAAEKAMPLTEMAEIARSVTWAAAEAKAAASPDVKMVWAMAVDRWQVVAKEASQAADTAWAAAEAAAKEHELAPDS